MTEKAVHNLMGSFIVNSHQTDQRDDSLKHTLCHRTPVSIRGDIHKCKMFYHLKELKTYSDLSEHIT